MAVPKSASATPERTTPQMPAFTFADLNTYVILVSSVVLITPYLGVEA